MWATLDVLTVCNNELTCSYFKVPYDSPSLCSRHIPVRFVVIDSFSYIFFHYFLYICVCVCVCLCVCAHLRACVFCVAVGFFHVEGDKKSIQITFCSFFIDDKSNTRDTNAISP